MTTDPTRAHAGDAIPTTTDTTAASTRRLPRRAETTTRLPSYWHHRASGQAAVKLSERTHYLGPWRSKESKAEYRRLIAAWLANGRRPIERSGRPAVDDSMTVADLVAAYWRHAEQHYRKGGEPTSELACIRAAMRPLVRLYGATPAAGFGPLSLKAVRDEFIRGQASRCTVNGYVSRVKQAFRWGVENELLPASVHEGLRAVAGLKAGRSAARESEPVRPVEWVHVEAVLAYVSPQAAAMLRLMWWTGMRPGEVCAMRRRDLEFPETGPWIYRPPQHKTEHHGLAREVVIGPQGREVLAPWLRLDRDAYVFSPAEAESKRNEQRRGWRIMSPALPACLRPRRRRKPRTARRVGDCYSPASLRRAVDRAIARANAEAGHAVVPPWSPNQIRHAAATRLRREGGIELARLALGHTDAATTLVYAEADARRLREAMERVG